MNIRDKSCEERIDAEMADRLTELRELNESDDDEQREAHEPLSVETKKVTKILLSWVGPSDWYEVTQDESGAIEHIFITQLVYLLFAEVFAQVIAANA